MLHTIFLDNLVISKHIFFNGLKRLWCRHHRKKQSVSLAKLRTKILQHCYCRIVHVLIFFFSNAEAFDNHSGISLDYRNDVPVLCNALFKTFSYQVRSVTTTLTWTKSVLWSVTSFPLICTHCFIQKPAVLGNTLEDTLDSTYVFFS